MIHRDIKPENILLTAGHALVAGRAIEELHSSIDQRDIFLPEVFFDPIIDPLRGDQRFGAVLERMGLQRPAR